MFIQTLDMLNKKITFLLWTKIIITCQNVTYFGTEEVTTFVQTFCMIILIVSQ